MHQRHVYFKSEMYTHYYNLSITILGINKAIKPILFKNQIHRLLGLESMDSSWDIPYTYVDELFHLEFLLNAMDRHLVGNNGVVVDLYHTYPSMEKIRVRKLRQLDLEATV